MWRLRPFLLLREPAFVVHPGYSLVRGDPLIVVNPSAVSVSVRGAHLTQAAQSMNGSVPLIAGRDALLRVFVAAAELNSFRPGARAIFFGPGSRADTVSLTAAPGGIPQGEPDEGSLSKSFNAKVPGSLLAPGTEMVVELDREDIPLKSESVPRFPAAGRSRLDVRNVPPLHMTVVPVQWLSEANASTNAEVMDFARDMVTTDARGVTRFMRTVMPIGELRLRLREPYFTWGNRMEFGVSDLLDELGMLRHLEATRGRRVLSRVVPGARGSSSQFTVVGSCRPEWLRCSVVVTGQDGSARAGTQPEPPPRSVRGRA